MLASSMQRKSLWGFVVFWVFLAVASQASADKRPNIVLMVADDHGREAFGAYGNDVVKTPHLDQLAKEGVMFTDAYGTTASCSASRSVLLSGLHNHANGQYGHEHAYHHFRTFRKVQSLPNRLSAAGYRTARVGKYHIGPPEVYEFETVLNPGPDGVVNPGERNTIGMAKASRPFIQNDKDERPFFLYVATNDPHRAHETNSLGDNTFGNRSDNGKGMARLDYSPDEVIVPNYLPDIPETRRELAEYYQSVSRVDDTAGELVKILKESGEWDNTVFIYLSDNGTAMPGAKTTIYDPGVHLPLVVRTPKSISRRRGISVDGMVSWVDITPTILDMANVTADDSDFHGRSFRPLLDGKKHDGWDEVYGSHTFHEITMYYPMRMVQTREYKLIWNIAHGLEYPFASDLFDSSTWQGTLARRLENFGARPVEDYLKRAEFELYDMRGNPHEAKETHNLADDPKYAKVKEMLMDKLKTFQEQTGDPWVYKWKYE